MIPGRTSRQAFLPYLLVLPTLILFWLSPSGQPSAFWSKAPLALAQRYAAWLALLACKSISDLWDPSLDIGQDFPRILGNTSLFVGLTVPISLLLGFFLALILNPKIRGSGLFRFAFFYPVLMPTIGAGSVFAFLFAGNIGLLNTVLCGLQLAPIP
ncbi:MAG: carbohydrate ABC transporter permease [Cyanobacteriota bacterium]